MPNPFNRLYAPNGSVLVRAGQIVADGAAWTPDDEGGSFAAVVFDGDEWEDVNISPVFTDGSGAIVDGTSIVVTPLIWVPDSRAALGRIWRELTSTGVILDEGVANVAVDGHKMGFRITTVTLGGGTDVGITVTGGSTRTSRV